MGGGDSLSAGSFPSVSHQRLSMVRRLRRLVGVRCSRYSRTLCFLDFFMGNWRALMLFFLIVVWGERGLYKDTKFWGESQVFWGFFLIFFLCWWYGEPMVRVSVVGMKKATLLWEKVAWRGVILGCFLTILRGCVRGVRRR